MIHLLYASICHPVKSSPLVYLAIHPSAPACRSVCLTPNEQFIIHPIESIGVAPPNTFLQIKEMIWKKKNLAAMGIGAQTEFTFKLTNGEIYFEDNEKFSRLLEYVPLFREDNSPMLMVEAALVKKRVEDAKLQVKKSVVSLEQGPIMIKGHLYIKAKSWGNHCSTIIFAYFVKLINIE